VGIKQDKVILNIAKWEFSLAMMMVT
jgi:hypothetical protein